MKKNATMMAAIVAALLATTLPTLAQNGPDTGAGVRRGTQEMKNSGQVGTATLFGHGSTTNVVLEIKSSRRGHEVASINRGKGCDPSQIDPVAAYTLNDVVNGRSGSVVKAMGAKLLSSNYVVVVRSATSEGYVSCGHLYI